VFCYFLDMPLAAYPDAPIVAVICDNGGTHHSTITTKWLAEHPRLQLINGARYSPQDNLVERIWAALKQHTAAFAVESIRRWWNAIGRYEYPTAGRLLITADAGGSNGYRTRAWKTELAAFAAQTGLRVTVCHFPPGTSKWNKVEPGFRSS
jgi:hypothetical protein